jgi:glyoxylase I family protein
MEKVTGIGGLFFRSENPQDLASWYETHLGISKVPGDYDTPCWRQEEGETVFAPFEKVTDYFGNQEKQFMINFRVRDLEAMIAQLEAAGIEVRRDPNSPYPNGSFAWLNDPEGNPIELWQPA